MTNGNFLNLAGPPRSVPLLVRVKVLVGGFSTQFGCFFVGFGLIFVWVFTLNSDLTSWYRFRGPLETADGTVLHSKKTSFSVGGSDDSDGTPVYSIRYSFTGPGTEEYQNVSYVPGRELEEGRKVVVEYPKGDPETSRIRGMRSSPMGLFGLMPVIFPLLGVWFMITGLRKGVRANRLLTIGEQATGRLKSKVATGTRINDRTVYKLTFEFTTPDGTTHEAVGKTHTPEKLEDEAEEPLLYDPLRPSYAVMLDALPGSPRIDEYGNIRAGSAIASLLYLVVPAATVVGHGGYVYVKFLSN